MKKFTLVAVLCAMAFAPSMKAQEVTYVEDPAQGYLFNKFQDNWFITAEGGANVLMSSFDKSAKFGNRIGYSVDLSFGKWFSPVIGLRLGVVGYQFKGVTPLGEGTRADKELVDGMFQSKFWEFGPKFDVMLNLTNWWCGYRPGRVYNAVAYAGAGGFWTVARENLGAGAWKNAHSRGLMMHVGLMNTFRLSNHWDFLIDLRASLHNDYIDLGGRNRFGAGHVLLGFNYKFNKTEWNAPVTAVCPTWKYTDAEGDALVARLQAADAKIADLEAQLRECLNRKPQVIEKEVKKGPLATVYYEIGRSNINGVQRKVVNAVANVMKETNKDYLLTGWADNYTGTAKINTKLRNARVNGVKKALVAKGVKAEHLETAINDNNLTNFGKKCATLDRAVTIEEK